MKSTIIPVTPFEQNCSLIWCEKTRKAAVIDPGGDLELIKAAAEREGVSIEKILLTHGHIDHVGGTRELADQHNIAVVGPHEGDRYWIDGLAMQAQQFGFPEPPPFSPDQWLNDGDTVSVGDETLDVLHCPGHCPGHVIFFHAASKTAWVGDVLFKGSIGRTDFPGGVHADLIASIREKLWPLGDDVTFIPGHGPTSTFGHERKTNPFVGDDA